MKRRTFLQNTAAAAGAAAVASAAGPLLLGMEDKAGSKTPVIGSGEFKYECHHNWGQLPRDFQWETTHGVTIDEAGNVYIKQQGHDGKLSDTILVFDPDGKFIRSWGKSIYPGGHGIDIRKEGSEEFLYLCDTAHWQVLKATLSGDEYVWKMGAPREPGVYKKKTVVKKDESPYMPYKPTNVAFAPDGGFYVGDGYGSHFIHQYDKDAKWVRTWGGIGTEPGKFNTPHGLWLDDRPGREPSLVVADRANARLQYFTLDGKFLSMVHDVQFPAHFDIRGEVLLVPDLFARVSLFDINNKAIVHLGYDENWTAEVKKNNNEMRMHPERWPAGKFIHPHDACFDRDGNIFVTEWVDTGRVTKLRKVS